MAVTIIGKLIVLTALTQPAPHGARRRVERETASPA
jgi:hypothetical protein